METMKKSTLTIFCILAGCIFFLSGIWIYFQKNLDRVELGEGERATAYQRHYLMIANDKDTGMWQSVYESASKEAESKDAYVELLSPEQMNGYSQADCLKIGIASKVDGIILEADGSKEEQHLITEALKDGIPVVTVMTDDTATSRISFVGLNSYQMGSAYGEKVAEYVTKDTESILILLKKNIDDMNQSQIYTQISNAAQAKAGDSQSIQVTGKNLLSTGIFETEEAVTDIFQQKDKVPDILVCMDEDTTECARQAVLDFNLAGKVTIIGYYSSDDILTAVEKGVISVTCDVDTEQLGRYSIEALTEYQKDGRTNSYYNVDINFLDREAVRAMRREVQPK